MSDEIKKESGASAVTPREEAIAQRVAEIVAGKMQGPRIAGSGIGQPATIVGHGRLRCKACGHVRYADSDEPMGGCNGVTYQSHDFHGMDTVLEEVDARLPHHAVFIEGTITHPASA